MRRKIEPTDGDGGATSPLLIKGRGNWLRAKAVGGTMVAGLGWVVSLVGALGANKGCMCLLECR